MAWWIALGVYGAFAVVLIAWCGYLWVTSNRSW
jgi:hypothetical protein